MTSTKKNRLECEQYDMEIHLEFGNDNRSRHGIWTTGIMQKGEYKY